MSVVKPDDPVLPILDAAKQAADELKELRDKLSSDTRHSFRTRLTVIDGTARRLERHAEKMSPEEVRDRVHTIRSSVERMVDIVERSIEMAELASCVKDNPPATSSLADVVDRLVQEHRNGDEDLSLISWMEDCDHLHVADRRLTELVLDKLLTLGEGIVKSCGRLDFVCWSDGQNANFSLKAVFEVRPPTDVNELSERFDEDRASRLSMLCEGMELKLIRLLVEQHCGEMDLELDADFVEFDIQLPIGIPDDSEIMPLIYQNTSAPQE